MPTFFKVLLPLYFILSGANFGFTQTADWILSPKISNIPFEESNYAQIKSSISDNTTGDSYVFSQIQDTVTYQGVTYISKNHSNDLLIYKTDAYGTIQWTKQIGGSSFEYGGNLVLLEDKLIVSMTFFDSTTIAGVDLFSPTQRGVALITLSKTTGNILKVEQLSINGTASLIYANNENFYMYGTYSTNSSIGSFNLPNPIVNSRPSRSIYLAKLDKDKKPIWVNTSYHSSCCVPPRLTDVKINPLTGELILAGYAYGNMSFQGNFVSGYGSTFSYIFAFSPDGNLKWSNKAEGSKLGGARTDVSISGLDIDSFGNIYIGGRYDDEAQFGSFILPEKYDNYQQGYVAKINSEGIFLWAKPIFGEYGAQVNTILCKDNVCYFGGDFSRSLILDSLIHFDPKSIDKRGFIGKIEANSSLDKLLVSKSERWSTVSRLARYSEKYIIGLGTFYTNITLGCIEQSGGQQIPYISKINLTDEIEAPLIDGEAKTCSNSSYVFNILNYDKNLSYSFNLPKGITITSKNKNVITLQISVDAPEIINIEAIVSNNCNWKAISKTLIISNPEPPILSGSIISPATICVDDKNVLIEVDTIKNAEYYHWRLPVGITANGNQELITSSNQLFIDAISPFKLDSIKVFGSNNCGISDELTTTIAVISNLEKPIIEGSNLICEGSGNKKFKVTIEPSFNNGNIQYLWETSEYLKFSTSINNPSQSNSIEISTLKITNDPQTLKVTIENECSIQESDIFYISTSPLPSIPILEIGDCEQTVTNVNFEKGFTWYYNGLPIDSLKTNEISILKGGQYKIRSENVCDTIWSDEFSINPIVLKNIVLPNVITPNGDGYNDFFELGKSLEDSHLTIYNRWGLTIFKSANYSGSWNGQNSSNGVYYYEIKNQCILEPIIGTISILR